MTADELHVSIASALNIHKYIHKLGYLKWQQLCAAT